MQQGGAVNLGGDKPNHFAQLASSVALGDQSSITDWLINNLVAKLIAEVPWDLTFHYLDTEVIPYQGYNEAQLAFVYTQLTGDLKDQYLTEFANLSSIVSASVKPDSLLYYGLDLLVVKETRAIVANITSYVDPDSVANPPNGMDPGSSNALFRYTISRAHSAIEASLLQQMADGVTDGTSYISFAQDVALALMDEAIANYGWTQSTTFDKSAGLPGNMSAS